LHYYFRDNMCIISNFYLSSRLNAASGSFFEKAGDFLLAPARVLFAGKEVVVLNDGSIHAMNSMEFFYLTFPLRHNGNMEHLSIVRRTIKIMAIVTLPFSLIGAAIKLPCFKDENYRKFCVQNLPQNPSKVVEIFDHVFSIRLHAIEMTNVLSSSLIFLHPSLADLKLSECACVETKAFHRFKSPRRNNLEKAIVQRLAEIHPDKNQPIRLLSMGSGGLMSDFITLEKLILEGFKNIIIDCVDPERIDSKKIEGVRDFFSKCSGISVSIHAYQNIKEIQREKGSYSAVLAVDYDKFDASKDAFIDLIKAHSFLSENGFLALGFGDSDTLSGKMMEIRALTSSWVGNLMSELTQHLKQKDEFMIAFPSFAFADNLSILLYPVFLAVEKSGKSYKKISIATLCEKEKSPPKFADFEHTFPGLAKYIAVEVESSGRTFEAVCQEWEQFGEEKIRKSREKFKTLIQVLFSNTETELCYHEQGKKYDLFFTGSEEEEFVSNTYPTLLHKEAIVYVLQKGIGAIHSQKGSESIPIYKK
jgi:hypothetical protein